MLLHQYHATKSHQSQEKHVYGKRRVSGLVPIQFRIWKLLNLIAHHRSISFMRI